MPKIETFKSWKRSVNDLLLKQFSINIVDAGMDQDQLKNYWQQEPSANNFVEWYAEKYDLIPVSNWGWPTTQTKA